MHEVLYRTCLCEECLNFSLIIDALLAARLKGVSRHMTETILASLCPPVAGDGDSHASVMIGDCARECIFRECSSCGASKLEKAIVEANPEYNFRKYVTWHQWMMEDDPETGRRHDYFKACYRDTAFKLLSLFSEKVMAMSTHLFHFRWQGHQFELIRNNLWPSEVLMVLDFTQNYEIKRGDEPQSSHWHHQQTTMHPVVTYFLCPDCNSHWKVDLIMLSSDHEHDAFAVKAFEDTAVSYLQNKIGLQVSRVIQFSDNCAAQYKSKLPFQILSQRDIPWERHFFGARHGKGPADAAIGNLKRWLDDHQCSDQSDFGSTEEIHEYCSENFVVVKKNNNCYHAQNVFFNVTNIDRDKELIARTLPGTQKLHCIRSTGVPGFIEFRENSCFCSHCQPNAPQESGNDGDGQCDSCEEARLVHPFRWKNIYGGAQTVAANFVNSHFRDTSAGSATQEKSKAPVKAKGKG